MSGGTTDPALRALRGVLDAHAPEAAMAWLARGLPSAESPVSRGVFFGFYAGAGRRFGHHPPPLELAERKRLAEIGLERPDAWTLADYARAALLLAAMGSEPEDAHVALAQEAFRKGDNAERVALLRALALLPRPERFVELAAEASRTHVQDVFEALAADNPFPARCLPELNWNQLVMKALFTGVAIDRIIGWQARTTPELQRMARDYEAERRAAGRPVPPDIERICAAGSESQGSTSERHDAPPGGTAS